jgi:ABC-2 type transport system ATP-binding protein
VTDPENIIEIKDLVKIYKGSSRPAIDQISMEIKKNEIYGILGPNGAGKSTLIKVLCGMFPPTSGHVKIDGYDIVRDISKIENIIGVVPQDIALYPSLTAYENLSFFGRIYGLKGKNLDKKIQDYLTIFGLEKSAKKRITTFSGGMKRRINLICGILHGPKILFLDEPTVGVDVQSKTLILESLLKLRDEGATIIYTSHLMDEAEHLCTRITIIDEGKLLKSGTPAELVSTDPEINNLEKVYLNLTGKSIRD